MPVREEALMVPYTTEEMFDLVIDVERYPQFVPGYQEARIVRREGTTLVAEQKVGYGSISATFHSQAEYERPSRIEIRSVEKPFDLLEIRWAFHPVPEGCRISFHAQARLGNGLVARLLQPWFDQLDQIVPKAFLNRARQIYGHRSGPGAR